MPVAAAFASEPHRIGYRSALDEHELLVHPARTIQVALTRQTKLKRLSARSLTAIREKPESISIGAEKLNDAWISSLERALLDAAARPELVGGAEVIAEAVIAAAENSVAQRSK